MIDSLNYAPNIQSYHKVPLTASKLCFWMLSNAKYFLSKCSTCCEYFTVGSAFIFSFHAAYCDRSHDMGQYSSITGQVKFAITIYS